MKTDALKSVNKVLIECNKIEANHCQTIYRLLELTSKLPNTNLPEKLMRVRYI